MNKILWIGIAVTVIVVILLLKPLLSDPLVESIEGNLDPSVKIITNSSSQLAVSYNGFIFDLTDGSLYISREDGHSFNLSHGGIENTVKALMIDSPNKRKVRIAYVGTLIAIQDGYGFVMYEFEPSKITLTVNRPPDQTAFANLYLSDGNFVSLQINPNNNFIIS